MSLRTAPATPAGSSPTPRPRPAERLPRRPPRGGAPPLSATRPPARAGGPRPGRRAPGSSRHPATRPAARARRAGAGADARRSLRGAHPVRSSSPSARPLPRDETRGAAIRDDLAVTVDGPAAHDRAHHLSAEPPPEVRGDSVARLELAGRHRPFALRIDEREVGVQAP